MPDRNVLPEVLSAQFQNLADKLDQVLDRQEKANGALGRHENWISAKDLEIEQIQDRLDADDERHRTIDANLKVMQSYMDQRSSAFQEHQEMKEQLAGMKDYDDLRKKLDEHHTVLAESRGVRRIVAEWCAIAGPIVAVLIGAWLAHSK